MEKTKEWNLFLLLIVRHGPPDSLSPLSQFYTGFKCSTNISDYTVRVPVCVFVAQEKGGGRAPWPWPWRWWSFSRGSRQGLPQNQTFDLHPQSHLTWRRWWAPGRCEECWFPSRTLNIPASSETERRIHINERSFILIQNANCASVEKSRSSKYSHLL